MNGGHRLNKSDALLLTGEDRANGFSIARDDHRNTTLLKWGRPIAWFAATVTEEVVVAFLKLIKDYESSDNKQAGNK